MTLRRLILHNFWLKLVSILLASLLWLVVQAGLSDDGNDTPRFARGSNPRQFERPVLVLTDLSAGRRFKAEPREVRVEVSGLGVQHLQSSDVHAYVELMEPAKMKGEVPIKVIVRIPRGLKLVKVLPETVVIRQVEAP